MEVLEEILQEANRCLQCKTRPCTKGCPLENAIPEAIQAVKQKNWQKANQLFQQTSCLSSVCGRVCPHSKQCEGACVRGKKGKPIAIGAIEAYVADQCQTIIPESQQLYGKKVAIVGGGPAGLTAGAFLAKAGASVTIYEKQEKLGGILTYGIPRFRLPIEVVESSIQKILALGIETKTGYQLGQNLMLEELQEQYQAIFLAMGANCSCKMPVAGNQLPQVYGANELLQQENHPEFQGKRVAVIGGGNVALDVARSAKRWGAKEVSIVYRRGREQMPAEPKEMQAAEQEGIQFQFCTNLVRILGQKNVEQMEIIHTQLQAKEGESRLVPVNIEGSNEILPIDCVIMAIGSKMDEKWMSHAAFEISDRGYLKTDEHYQTNVKGIFAGGDLVGAKATIAWACKTGREAAQEIKTFLLS